MELTKQQIWWNSLSKTTQDCINRSLFYQKIFELDKAYEIYKKTLK